MSPSPISNSPARPMGMRALRGGRRRRASGGFSLVEIMVAMVVGALGVTLMMQLFALSEGQKRSITGGGDAQTNAAIAVSVLRTEIVQGGYGFVYGLMNCDLLLPSGATLTGLAPVTINHASIPAGDPNTDTLLVVYGDSNYRTDGQNIINPSNAPAYTVRANTAINVNDRIIASAAAPCTPNPLVLDRVTAIAAVNGNADTPYNLTVTAYNAAVRGGTLYNFGPAPVVRVYAVRGGVLTVCDYTVNDCGKTDQAFWVPVAGNIVSLRAQYGRDTLPAVPGQVAYVVGTYDQNTPVSDCGWVRTLAVRVAMVARGDDYSKDAVTANAPAWDGGGANPIDLSSTRSDWRNYRYKLLQTVMPLRNVAWLGVQAGC